MEAVKHINETLTRLSVSINSPEDVRSIALVSSNQDQSITDVILDIYNKVGLRGAISIQDGSGFTRNTQVEYIGGLSIDSGFLSPYFAEDQKKIKYGNEGSDINTASSNIYVALVDGIVQHENELINLLEFAKKTMRPLLIFAHDFSSDALSCLVVNKLQLGLKVVAIKLPMLQ